MVDLVLGDDHEIFVDAMRTALPQWGFTVVGTAGTLATTLATMEREQPDVCLLDRYFSDGDGVEAVADTVSRSPRTKVLLLTADGDTSAMRRALTLGAAGYVNKTCGLSVLAAAIHGVMDGEIVVELAAGRTAQPAGAADALRLAAQLTARERECLELLVEGLPTEAMAKRLYVSRTTVRTHVQSILTKLGVHSRLEAAALVQRYSLLNTSGSPLVPAAASRPAKRGRVRP